MAKSLRTKHPEENLHILVAKRNAGSFTYDGIELGGERVCQEIEDEVEKLARLGQEIKRFSLVGYSLGGLVARYAVGLLDSKGFFEKIKPVVSFTPLPAYEPSLIGSLELYNLCNSSSRCTNTPAWLAQSHVCTIGLWTYQDG
jgi:hypothetical protein